MHTHTFPVLQCLTFRRKGFSASHAFPFTRLFLSLTSRYSFSVVLSQKYSHTPPLSYLSHSANKHRHTCSDMSSFTRMYDLFSLFLLFSMGEEGWRGEVEWLGVRRVCGEVPVMGCLASSVIREF